MIERDSETEVGESKLVDTLITNEEEIQNVEISTEFKSTLIEMSCESCCENVVVDIGFEKQCDTVDFSVSVEGRSIEVGSEMFGEIVNIVVDSLTTYETKIAVVDECSEFISTLPENESYSETIFREESCSQEEGKSCDLGVEISVLTVASSSEFSMKLIETGIEEYKNTTDVGTEVCETIMIDGVSCNDISFVSVDCETTEVVEEIVADSEELLKSEILKTEDEELCCTIIMNDMSTDIRCNIVDICEEMEVSFAECSIEWIEQVKKEDHIMETEGRKVSESLISSDFVYLTIDTQFDEVVPITIETGCDAKLQMVDCYSEYKVIFCFFFMQKILYISYILISDAVTI